MESNNVENKNTGGLKGALGQKKESYFVKTIDSKLDEIRELKDLVEKAEKLQEFYASVFKLEGLEIEAQSINHRFKTARMFSPKSDEVKALEKLEKLLVQFKADYANLAKDISKTLEKYNSNNKKALDLFKIKNEQLINKIELLNSDQNPKSAYMLKRFIILLLVGFILFMSLAWAHVPKSPEPPLSGPGSPEYKHAEVIKTSYGGGAKQYWIYEPGSPKPVQAPIIVFNHGWGAIYPEVYEAWIIHIVIYPRYQESILTPSDNFTPNAIDSIKSAINELEKGEHVKPDINRLAIVGHSVGGLISINIAAVASDSGIPVPKAVFCVEPGKHRTQEDHVGPVVENLSKVPQNTLLLTLSGDQDNITGNEDAIKIFKETTQIPAENKDYIILKADGNGYPPLFADHLAPFAVLRTPYFSVMVNLLDYYGTWKLFDGLTDAAFNGLNRDYALGNTSNQRYMGIWGDGMPVNQMIVVDNP